MTDTSWMDYGSCKGQPLEVFYPERPLYNGIGLAAAKLCFQCPVQAACLDWALTRNEHGIWGGTSQADRAALRKGIPRKQCPACSNRRPQAAGDRQICMACGLSWHVRQRRVNADADAPR